VIGVHSLPGQENPQWQVTPNVNDLDDFNVQPNSPALAKALRDAAECADDARLEVGRPRQLPKTQRMLQPASQLWTSLISL
jgi:hypothetical protein